MRMGKSGFPGSSVTQNTANAGGVALIPGSGRSPGEGNGNRLHHFWQGNPMDGGAWQATVTGSQKSRTRLSD